MLLSPAVVEAAKNIIAAGALPRDAVCCLSKDAFRKEAALRVEGQPSNASPQLALSPVRCLIPARRRRCAAHFSGRVSEAVLLKWKYLLCEARPGPPPVNRRRARGVS